MTMFINPVMHLDERDQFGISSQSHFSHYVQKNLGVSPSYFRQKRGKNRNP